VTEPTAREALLLQLGAIRGHEPEGSFFELRPLTPDGQPAVRDRAFVPVRQVDEAIRLIFEQAPRLNAYVGAAPRTCESGSAAAVGGVHTLWADLDGHGPLARLLKFRPAPTIVILSGSPSCVHCYWALRSPISPTGAHRGNRRLALELGGDMNATDPARILRPAGSLNHKHDPPAEVTCARLTTDMFTLADVVGTLPDTDHYRTPQPTDRRLVVADPSSTLAGLVRTVAAAQVTNRNKALYWAARRARDHADCGELDPSEARAELRAAAAQTGLPEHEIERTLSNALDAGTRTAA
jgi:hypothetical protein